MSNRAAAWIVFAVGLVVLFVPGLFTMFLAAQAATGCDQSFGPEQTHPAFCGSDTARSLIVLLPLIVGVLYVVGGVVGILLLRRRRWVALLPLALAVLAVAAFVLEIVAIS